MDARGYRAASESMVPTLQLGDRVTLNQGAYDDSPPEIGDVVIHHPPAGAMAGNECGDTPPPGTMCARPKGPAADVSIIKRVVAGPGDRVAMRNGVVVRSCSATTAAPPTTAVSGARCHSSGSRDASRTATR